MKCSSSRAGWAMSSSDATKTSSTGSCSGLGSTIALFERASKTKIGELPSFKFKRPYFGLSQKSVPKGTPIKRGVSEIS
jgi:hypothetical protein